MHSQNFAYLCIYATITDSVVPYFLRRNIISLVYKNEVCHKKNGLSLLCIIREVCHKHIDWYFLVFYLRWSLQ